MTERGANPLARCLHAGSAVRTPDFLSHPVVLVTGAGSPSGVAFLQSMAGEPVELYAADVNRYAAGLFIVPGGHRLCLPPGDSPDYLRAVLSACAEHRVDVLVPTTDEELVRLSEARRSFALLGTSVLVPEPSAVGVCLDLLALMGALRGAVPTPRTAALDEHLNTKGLRFPLVTRTRQPTHEQGMQLLLTPKDLEDAARDGSFVVQEYLSGTEYDVEVLGSQRGEILGVVPVAFVGMSSNGGAIRKSVRNPEVEKLASATYLALGLRGPASICFREDRDGRPHLIGAHPRVGPGVLLAAAAGVRVGPHAVRELLGRPCEPIVSPIAEVASVAIVREELVPLSALEGSLDRDLANNDPDDASTQASPSAPGKAQPLLH